MGLLDEMTARIRQAADTQHVQAICEAVTEGMAPFNPVSVEITLVSGYGYPREMLVEARTLRGHSCRVDISDPDSIKGSEILEQIKQHFRTTRVQPEEHIQLGLE